MIKIAFIIDTIESPTAGTEKQLLMLIKHLDRAKFQPCLCVLRKSEWLVKEYRESELIEIGVPSFANPISYVNIAKFIRTLKKLEIDIVQTHFVEGSKVGTIAAKLAGIKTIIGTRRNQGYWLTRSELVIQKQLNQWVTAFLANSEDTRQWAARVEGIDPARVTVIHNSLELEKFYRASDEQRAAFREQHGFPADSILIGIVANLRKVKAHEVFLGAAQQVADKNPLARFVIVGEGPERQTLETLCTVLGLQSRVRFLGKRTDIPEILGCLDIGVLSSTSESFSNAIVEYMAAGLAVVCTDVGGAREAIEDGVEGYVVEPGNPTLMADRIISILEDNAAERMGCLAQEKARGLFALESIIDKYQKFYEEVA